MNRLQLLLTPLVPLYAAALASKNFGYDRHWITPKRLEWPVISVGSLSIGGAGKTPVVIRLAQLLRDAGCFVDVLSRGYGRISKEVSRVDPEGSAAQFGDEPLLIARTGAPVYVAANRYEAGALAEREQSDAAIHLLDDGFQHRRLARDFDIVVLHRRDFEEHLLPAGRLREPLSALKRASALILRAENHHFEAELRSRNITAPIWIQHRRLVVESTSRAVAFCGIARPNEFFAALRANIEVAATSSYGDHRPYTGAGLDALLQLRARHGAQSFITTEKDFVRLTPAQRARLAPLHTARLEVLFENEAAITAQLAGLLVRK